MGRWIVEFDFDLFNFRLFSPTKTGEAGIEQEFPVVIAKALLSAHAVLLREFDMFEKSVRTIGADGQTRQADGVNARRRRDRGADLCFGDRLSVVIYVVESGRATFRPDAEKISVGRDRRYRADHQDRRRRRAHGALSSRQCHTDAASERWRPQELGAMKLAKRAGMKKAKVALARKLGVILHRMSIDGAPFDARRAACAAPAAA